MKKKKNDVVVENGTNREENVGIHIFDLEKKKITSVSRFLDLLFIHRLFPWTITLLFNFALIVITLFYKHEMVPYILAFSVISIGGHLLFFRK